MSRGQKTGLKESDIVYESGNYWVLDTGVSYEVRENRATYSVTDGTYYYDKDGLSIAISRCEYLAKRSPNVKR